MVQMAQPAKESVPRRTAIELRRNMPIVNRVILAFTAAMLGAQTWAQGTSPVTVADLRAAYCRPAVRAATEIAANIYNTWGSSARPPELESLYSRQNFKMDKINNYLRARVVSLNEDALVEFMTADKAGERALDARNKIFAKCQAIISSDSVVGDAPLKQLQECADRQGVKDLRLDQCNEISYLPY